MSEHEGLCLHCNFSCFWQDCPTGGWWIHEWPNKSIEKQWKKQAEHDADPGWNPAEEMDVNGHWNTVPTKIGVER